MLTISSRGHNQATRFAFAVSILFVSSAAGLAFADETITGGAITANPQAQFMDVVQIQGPNLTISGHSIPAPPGADPLGLFSVLRVDYDSVTFGISHSFQNSSLFNVVYKGTAYSNVLVDMQLSGPAATVINGGPSNPPDSQIVWSGSVSNVPFTMNGTVTIYSGSDVLFVIPISGSGLYSASGVQFRYSKYGANASATFQFTPGPALDPTTQGSWNGIIGADGYVISNGATKLPSYGSVALNNALTYTWAPQTPDPRALQNGAGAATRIASAYTQYPNNSFSANINIVDGHSHQVAFYLLDWDSTTRSETIVVRDAATNAVLDSKVYSNFHDGAYAVWNLQGNVNITVTPSAGTTPVVSGIFFGSGMPAPPPPTLASATYKAFDIGHGGTWTGPKDGYYGLNGYMIANGVTKASPYAVASVTGATAFTWAGLTSEARALQLVPGADNYRSNGVYCLESEPSLYQPPPAPPCTPALAGMASAYTQYQSTSFNINLNVTDGNPHSVSLYMMDWDGNNRAQNITIIDASTNVLLDSRTFSGFHDGLYATWNIKGNVTIKVTPIGTTSPVVSGIFFN